MKTELTFAPDAKFFRDADGFPVVVEGGASFIVVNGSKSVLPASIPFPTGEEPGSKVLSEAEFRELASKAFGELASKAAISSTAKDKARPLRYYQPEEGAAAVRRLLTDFEPETITLLLDRPAKLKAALEARLPKSQEQEQFKPDSQEAQEGATAWADSQDELAKLMEPYGLEGWKKLTAALESISREFVGCLL